MTEAAIDELAPVVGVRNACSALGEDQARWYRRHRRSPLPTKPERVATPQPRALSEVERKERRGDRGGRPADQGCPAPLWTLRTPGPGCMTAARDDAAGGPWMWASCAANSKPTLLGCVAVLTG